MRFVQTWVEFAAASPEARQLAIKVAGDGDVFELMPKDDEGTFDALVHVDLLPWRLVHERIGLVASAIQVDIPNLRALPMAPLIITAA
jgi:hypothetical protein